MTRFFWAPVFAGFVLAACSTASSAPPEGEGVGGTGGGETGAGAAGKETAAGASAGATDGGAGKVGGDAGSAGEGGAPGGGGGAGGTAEGGAGGQSGSLGTSGAAGAGGMCTLVAKYSSKDSFCNACAESKCCAEVNGCLGDARCNDDYVNCQLACALLPDDEDPQAIKACFAQCGVDYPEGKKLYDSAIGCVDASCAGICE